MKQSIKLYEQLLADAASRKRELWGDNIPYEAYKRLARESKLICSNEYAISFELARRLMNGSREFGCTIEIESVGIRSSLIAYLLGCTETNPLPPHHYCRECRLSLFPKQSTRHLWEDLEDRDCPICGKPMLKDGFDLMPSADEEPPDLIVRIPLAFAEEALRILEECFIEFHLNYSDESLTLDYFETMLYRERNDGFDPPVKSPQQSAEAFHRMAKQAIDIRGSYLIRYCGRSDDFFTYDGPYMRLEMSSIVLNVGSDPMDHLIELEKRTGVKASSIMYNDRGRPIPESVWDRFGGRSRILQSMNPILGHESFVDIVRLKCAASGPFLHFASQTGGITCREDLYRELLAHGFDDETAYSLTMAFSSVSSPRSYEDRELMLNAGIEKDCIAALDRAGAIPGRARVLQECLTKYRIAVLEQMAGSGPDAAARAEDIE